MDGWPDSYIEMMIFVFAKGMWRKSRGIFEEMWGKKYEKSKKISCIVNLLSVYEMADITFSRSLGILMNALMASLQEILKLSNEQLTIFTADFEESLLEYLRNALHPKAIVHKLAILLATNIEFSRCQALLRYGKS